MIFVWQKAPSIWRTTLHGVSTPSPGGAGVFSPAGPLPREPTSCPGSAMLKNGLLPGHSCLRHGWLWRLFLLAGRRGPLRTGHCLTRRLCSPSREWLQEEWEGPLHPEAQAPTLAFCFLRTPRLGTRTLRTQRPQSAAGCVGVVQAEGSVLPLTFPGRLRAASSRDSLLGRTMRGSQLGTCPQLRRWKRCRRGSDGPSPRPGAALRVSGRRRTSPGRSLIVALAPPPESHVPPAGGALQVPSAPGLQRRARLRAGDSRRGALLPSPRDWGGSGAGRKGLLVLGARAVPRPASLSRPGSFSRLVWREARVTAVCDPPGDRGARSGNPGPPAQPAAEVQQKGEGAHSPDAGMNGAGL